MVLEEQGGWSSTLPEPRLLKPQVCTLRREGGGGPKGGASQNVRDLQSSKSLPVRPLSLVEK